MYHEISGLIFSLNLKNETMLLLERSMIAAATANAGTCFTPASASLPVPMEIFLLFGGNITNICKDVTVIPHAYQESFRRNTDSTHINHLAVRTQDFVFMHEFRAAPQSRLLLLSWVISCVVRM